MISSLLIIPPHPNVLYWEGSQFLGIIFQKVRQAMKSSYSFAGPKACQPLGILHWSAADGETEAKYAAHVYQVLCRPLLPGWQYIDGRALQLWDLTSKYSHF